MLSLFSGIGGIDLAAQWAGIETIAFCEIDKFCQKILNKHWPAVQIFQDVRAITKEALDNAGIGRIDIVAGGWPCQPWSIAGKQRCEEDDRHLWPEMFRIVKELKPNWIVGENVANFAKLGIDNTLCDLESIGYSAIPYIIPACAAGSKDRRERVFIVAHIDSKRRNCSIGTYRQHEIPNNKIWSIAENIREWSGWQRWIGETFQNGDWSEDNSKIRGMDNGFSSRMDENRVKALGNAVKPQQIYPIFKTIMDIESGVK